MKCYRSFPITYCVVSTICALLPLLITGCGTTHESELLEIHDTITANHVDTVTQYVSKTVHDTIHHHMERIVTVNEKGDTIRETNNNYYYQHTIERDSDAYYRHLIDSLVKSLNQNHEHEKTVEKSSSWWELWKWKIIAFAAIILIVKLIFRKKKKIINLMR